MPTEGALAPDLMARLMPAKLEPVREIPGRRRREPAWKDEVRQRVNRRRAQRLGTELPLFPDPEPDSSLDEDLEVERETPMTHVAAALLEPEADTLDGGPRLVWSTPAEEPAPPHKAPTLDMADAPAPHSRWSLGHGDEEEEPVDEPEASGAWVFGDALDEEASSAARPAPVERPAQWTDRLQAAAFDLGLLAMLWAVVVYFASRAARVSLDGLWASWPFLVGYLAFLGFVYAVYFTGTCGRTVGKIVCGLKVVDVAGNPPGYPRAFARAVLGTAGMLFGMVGMLPIFFDPARRSLHDRLLRTRVVKY